MSNLIRTVFLLLLVLTNICSSFAQIEERDDIRYAIEGKYAKAVKSIDKLIEKDPVNARYHINKAQYQLDLKDYEEAIKTLTKATKLMPDSADLFDMQGAIIESFGMHREASLFFSLATEKATDDKNKAHYLMNLGGVKHKMRDYQGSYNDLILAYHLDSTNINVLNNLAVVCDDVDRPNETLTYLMRILEIDPNNVPAYVNLGFKHQSLGLHNKAIKYFDQAIELQPQEALGWSNRAFSKLKTNDLDGAFSDINKAIELYTVNSYAYKIRALIFIERGKTKKACEDLSTAQQLKYTEQYGSEVEELIKAYCE